jgi:hypothetical protein
VAAVMRSGSDEDRGGSSLARKQRRARESSGERGKGAVKAGDGAFPFIGAGDDGEVVVGGNNRRLMAHAIDGRGGLRRRFKRGNKGGGVKTWTWHLYAEVGRRMVTGCGGEKRQHGPARRHG